MGRDHVCGCLWWRQLLLVKDVVVRYLSGTRNIWRYQYLSLQLYREKPGSSYESGGSDVVRELSREPAMMFPIG